MSWPHFFSSAWRRTPLRFLPAVFVGLVYLVAIFGCQRWLPRLLGVTTAVHICSFLFAVTGAVTGVVTIITYFLVNKDTAEHPYLYAKYCATAVLMFLVFVAVQYGTVHIYYVALLCFIASGAAFVVVLIVAMIEALLVCVFHVLHVSVLFSWFFHLLYDFS